MAQIFISYAREDKAHAVDLVRAMERLGHEVWWDHKLAAGSRYRRVIEDEIRRADATVVIWSNIAVRKDFVLDEAEVARALGRLIPISLGAEPPIGFRQLHYINLSGKGLLKDEHVVELGRAIAEIQGGAHDVEVMAAVAGKAPYLPGGDALRAFRELGSTVGGLPIQRFVGGVLAAAALAASAQAVAELLGGEDEGGSGILFVAIVAALAATIARACSQFLLLATKENSRTFFDRTFSFWSLLTLLIAAILFAAFMNERLSGAELTTEAIVGAFGAIAGLFVVRTLLQLSKILASRV